MPYELMKSRGKKEGYYVITKDTREKHSKKPLPLEKAKAQMRALYAAESGYEMRGGRIVGAGDEGDDDELARIFGNMGVAEEPVARPPAPKPKKKKKKGKRGSPVPKILPRKRKYGEISGRGLVGGGYYTTLLDYKLGQVYSKYAEKGVVVEGEERATEWSMIRERAKIRLDEIGPTRDDSPVASNPRRARKEMVIQEAVEEADRYLRAFVRPTRSKYGGVGFKEELNLLAKEALEKVDGFLKRGHRGSVPADIRRYILHVVERAKERIREIGPSNSNLDILHSAWNVANEWSKWSIVEGAMKHIEEALEKVVRDAYKVMGRVIPSSEEVDRMMRLTEARGRIKKEMDALEKELPKKRKATKKVFGPTMTGKGMEGGSEWKPASAVAETGKPPKVLEARLRNMAHYYTVRDPAKAFGYRVLADDMFEYVFGKELDKSHKASQQKSGDAALLGMVDPNIGARVNNFEEQSYPVDSIIVDLIANKSIPPQIKYSLIFNPDGSPAVDAMGRQKSRIDYKKITSWLGFDPAGLSYTPYGDLRFSDGYSFKGAGKMKGGGAVDKTFGNLPDYFFEY